MTPEEMALLLSAFMVSCGVIGFLIRRHMISMLIASELVLNGANVALVAFARSMNSTEGQVFALVVMTVAACEGAVGLALAVNLYRQKRNLNVDALNQLKG